ncbi:MAG: hypothetical protein H0W08_17195 [Acidobacteria bacterium]|nr:hypothetical protein [Acidobacteriota bacterium]
MRWVGVAISLSCLLPAPLAAQSVPVNPAQTQPVAPGPTQPAVPARTRPVTPAQARPAPKPPAPAPVVVRTWVSRTAVWLGDRVTYVVELQAAPEIEILADDLDPDRLTVEGLEILDVATERDASVPGRVTHRTRYGLVTYQVDAPALTIAAIPVRYSLRQPGQRQEDAVPAGEVVVPPLVLALRSTLAPTAGAIAIRDARPVMPLPRWVRLAQPVGIGLLVLSVVPVALWGAGLAQRARRSRTRRAPRRSMKQRRADLEEIKMLEVSSESDRRNAYVRLDAWIREQIHHATGIAAAGLTPAEVPAALPRPFRSIENEDLKRLLGECERAKYAPQAPPADGWRSDLEAAEHLLDSRTR